VRAGGDPRHLPALLLLVALGACAPRTALVLPQGPGEPIDPAIVALESARRDTACASVQAMTADVRVSGRVDGQRVRGTLQVGVDRTGVRIEAVPPLGAPVFVLAGRSAAATLLLPRERAYVEAPVPDLTEAVVGIALTPDDLLAVLTGCGVPATALTGGRQFGAHWIRLDTVSGARLWLRPDGLDRRLVAAEAGAWRVVYDLTAGASTRGTLHHAVADTHLSFTVHDPETLDALPEAAYDVRVGLNDRPIRLDDLRGHRALAER
jgi:hypothetical protein